MQIRPTAFTIGLIIHFSIALFSVYTEFGIDSGNCDEAVRIIDNEKVFVNIKYLKRYAAAKQMGIVLFFDIRYEISGLLAENKLSKLNEEYKDTSLIYELYGDENATFGHYTFSRLLGKKVIMPLPVSECGYFPYEKKRDYVEYIIGCDCCAFLRIPTNLRSFFGYFLYICNLLFYSSRIQRNRQIYQFYV